MAPEILMQKNYSFSCDIWSLGIILYELCTLNCPFNPSFLLNFYNSNKLNIYDKFPKNYSQNIKILIQKMLNTEPKERPNINQVLEYIITIKNRNLIVNKKLSIKNNKYSNIKTEGDSPLKDNVKKINQNLKNNFKRKRYLSCKKENIENECDGREEEEEEEKEEKKEEEEKWEEENNNKKENLYKNNNKYDRNCYQKQKRDSSAQKSKRLDLFSSNFLNNIEPNNRHEKIKMKSFSPKKVNINKFRTILLKKQLTVNLCIIKNKLFFLRYDKGNNLLFISKYQYQRKLEENNLNNNFIYGKKYENNNKTIYNPYYNRKSFVFILHIGKNNNNFIDNNDKEFNQFYQNNILNKDEINESRSRPVDNNQNNFYRNININNKNVRLNYFQKIFFYNK